MYIGAGLLMIMSSVTLMIKTRDSIRLTCLLKYYLIFPLRLSF